MGDQAETHNDLKRLQMALQAVSADLDSIERRPHFALWFAAENLVNSPSQRIERFVDHFAFAVNREHLDDWRRKQDDLPGRPEAIRRLLELELKAKTK